MENDSEISMSSAIGMNSDVLKINAVIVIPNSIMYWRGSIVIVHPSLSVFSLCDSIHIVEKNKKNARGGNALFCGFSAICIKL